MQRTFRALALVCGLLLLAACSHKDKDAPLAFVPSDTPYLVANLEPLDADTRAAMLEQADAQLPAQVAQLRDVADRLDAEKDAHLAGLLRALATELDGRTTQQIAAADGLRLDGRFALYGVGLAPVMRIDLDDPAKFEAFVDRLEKGYGKPLDKATLGTLEYRHTTAAGDSPLQMAIAIDGKQAVLAALPANADQVLLRRALGVDRPDDSAQERGRLATLAKANGYQPYVVGYVDNMRVADLLADGNDPIVRAFVKDDAAATTPACRGDLERIAARVPMISAGYTRLEAKQIAQRVDVTLASDIIKAFAGTKVALPGLGGGATAAPFDLALALPVERIRTFWTAQADAVAAKPFTCPMLTDLNAQFAALRQGVQKSALPPFGDLLGARVSLDSFAADAAGGMPKVSGRLLVASRSPAGLLAMAQAMLPSLAELKLSADGKPAALPAPVTGMAGAPAWAAMSDKALAIGVGEGGDARLGEMLRAPGGDAGQLFRMHVDGDMYVQWIDMLADRATAVATAGSSESANSETGRRMATQFDAARAQAARIRQVAAEGHFDERGLVVTSQTELR